MTQTVFFFYLFKILIHRNFGAPCSPQPGVAAHFTSSQLRPWPYTDPHSLILFVVFMIIPCLNVINLYINQILHSKLNSVALVRERTIPTERPPPVGEVSANFCG